MGVEEGKRSQCRCSGVNIELIEALKGVFEDVGCDETLFLEVMRVGMTLPLKNT